LAVVVPASEDQSVPVAIDATSSAGWPVEIIDAGHPIQTAGGPYADPIDASSRQLTTVTHTGETIDIVVRAWVPEDTPDGATTDITVNARPITSFDGVGDGMAGSDDPSLATSVESVAGLVAAQEEAVAVVPPEMVGFDLPADQTTAHSVVTVASSTALHIRGDGVDFGDLSPLGTGANPGIDVAVSDAGATYTDLNAVTIDVMSGAPAWSIVCSVSGEGLVSASGAARLEWRVSGTTDWRPFLSEAGVCVTGGGDETIELDVRYHVAWTDPPGSMSAAFYIELVTG
jgi:hypothetical protein